MRIRVWESEARIEREERERLEGAEEERGFGLNRAYGSGHGACPGRPAIGSPFCQRRETPDFEVWM